ncbi:G-patch domain-containing protein 1 isoform X2 [Cryptomeria japonica]|uniref:G-patch domain-containing protein 1 isoform X2 n=1 Tax=Cryptomeria japonica TaxID=3369 RepID=UPI0025ABAC96|nr:G-patch domain-containing protein 1 isoform X2 [Cryptomeria japonica]
MASCNFVRVAVFGALLVHLQSWAYHFGTSILCIGWEEGEGLGKDGQGIKEHVKVKKKQDTTGIGLDKAANNWTFNTTEFDNILQKLKVQVAGSEAKENEEKPKVKHIETSEVSIPVLKTVRPQGRYKKRERGKLVSGYSEKELQEILGSQAATSGVQSFGETPEINVVKEESDSGAQLDESTFEEGSANLNSTSSVVLSQISRYQSPEWWGHKYGFVWGGLLGSKPKSKKDTRPKGSQSVTANVVQGSALRTTFCEQDQENLYNLVQDKATTGKRGLGIGDRPKKIAGAHWKGQKVSFDSDNDKEGGSADDSDVKQTVAKNNSLKRKRDVDLAENKAVQIQNAISANEDDARKETEVVSGPKLKLKRICKQLLREAPGQSMKIKNLKKCVEAHSSFFFSEFSCRRDAVSYLTRKLEKNSKFVVDGKNVSLSKCS